MTGRVSLEELFFEVEDWSWAPINEEEEGSSEGRVEARELWWRIGGPEREEGAIGE